MNTYIAIFLILVIGIICFFLGLAVGSAGKASERERADYAVEVANNYKKQVDELEKIDLMR